MTDTFLQSFLRTGLFDIGDSDERLKWLKQAIEALQKKLSEDYSLIPAYTLISLDPDVSDQEPVLIDTEEIVTMYWQALRGKYPDMPRNIHRGVILNALYAVGAADAIAARIIYLTGTNFYPFARLGREAELVSNMFSELANIAENNAVEQWSYLSEEPNLKLSPLKITGLAFGKATFDEPTLKAELQRATNTIQPAHNLHAWSEHFGTNGAAAISKVINSAFESFSNSVSPSIIEAPLNKYFTDFKKSLDANLKIAISSLNAVEQRSKLLWWKETLYSSSLKKSYRQIDSSLRPMIMCSDLNDLLPEITPISVDYLLKDTLYLLNEKQDEQLTFLQFFSAIDNKEKKEIIKEYFVELAEQDGRITMTNFVNLFAHERVTVEDLKEKTGIDKSASTTLGNIAVSMLHDLLVNRLISE
jgi:Ca2+-binding EF-hand superfamily protein